MDTSRESVLLSWFKELKRKHTPRIPTLDGEIQAYSIYTLAHDALKQFDHLIQKLPSPAYQEFVSTVEPDDWTQAKESLRDWCIKAGVLDPNKDTPPLEEELKPSGTYDKQKKKMLQKSKEIWGS